MFLAILVGIVALVLGLRAANAENRVRRIGYFALASGVAAYAPAIIAANELSPERESAFLACSAVATLLGVCGCILSIRTLSIRRNNAGIALGIPVFGLLFGVLGMGLGVGIYLLGGRVLIPSDEKQWVWHCEQHSFDVTIPSERWTQKPNSNVLGEFRGSRPTIAAMVAEARPGATDEEFAMALDFGAQMQANTPTTDTFQEKGKNSFGNPYWIYMGDAKNAKNEVYFFGFSITRVRDKSVIMLVEGPYHMRSQVGHKQEADALRAQAKTFLGSAR